MTQPDNSAAILNDLNRRNFIRGSSFAAFMAMMGGVEITAADADKTLPVPKADPNYKEKPPGPPVNMGIIGMGVWGREIASTLAKLPNGPVVAVSDSYGSSLRRATELAPKAEKYEDYRKLLEDTNVKGVIVATPTHQHKQIVLDALQAGKHVYCEAPLSNSIEEAKAIALAGKAASKLIFQAGLQTRANPQHHHVVNFIRAGAMGRAISARSQYHKKTSLRRASPNADREKALNWRLSRETSTGLIGEFGIHSLAVTRWFFNALPVSVTGFGGTLHWTDGRDVPDTIQAVVEFPGGARLVHESTLASSFESEYEVFHGTDAAVMMRERRAWMFKEVDSPLLGWEVYARKEEFFSETGIALVANATKLLAQGKKPAEAAADSAAPLQYSLQEFVDNINENKKPAAGYQEGYESTVMAIRANESILSGQKIEFNKDSFSLS